jgi:hypothetical protein
MTLKKCPGGVEVDGDKNALIANIFNELLITFWRLIGQIAQYVFGKLNMRLIKIRIYSI